MRKIIVTGGLGFIGSNLINYLIKKKDFIINIDKVSYSSTHYNIKNINKKNYIFYKLDINNKHKLLKILKKHRPVGLFNLAAETHVDRSIDNPHNFIKSNINGVYNLLEALKIHNKRSKIQTKLIHVSTDEVYGDISKNNERSNENFPYKPSSPYAASKAASDHLIKSYIRTYGLQAVISNCSNNYGPAQFPEKIIPKLILNIINKKPLPIYGKGINSREWIYVEDHCRALEILLNKGKIGESYNIGSGKDLSNIQLAKLILKIMSSKIENVYKNSKITFVKDRPGHDIRYALNSKKISKFLGWKSKINIEEGLAKTIDWYLNNNNYLKSISKKNYLNRMGLSK
jgi:dTDP-glucose 4,6-dehydratase